MEKIKIDWDKLKNESKNATHELGDSTIIIDKWIEPQNALYIISNSLELAKKLIQDKSDDAVVLYSVIAHMNMLMAYFATNIELDDIDISMLGETPIFRWLEQDVNNYTIIKDSVLAGLDMTFNGLVLEQVSNISSVEEIEKAQEDIMSLVTKTEQSNNLTKLIEVMLANNPKIADELGKTIAGEANGTKE